MELGHLQDARTEVEKIIGRGGLLQLKFRSPQGKACLEQSFQEARQLGHNHIGPEHLLLRLIQAGKV